MKNYKHGCDLISNVPYKYIFKVRLQHNYLYSNNCSSAQEIITQLMVSEYVLTVVMLLLIKCSLRYISMVSLCHIMRVMIQRTGATRLWGLYLGNRSQNLSATQLYTLNSVKTYDGYITAVCEREAPRHSGAVTQSASMKVSSMAAFRGLLSPVN